jgi:platelet-activating factor acetylhydrolase IB subunit alpha
VWDHESGEYIRTLKGHTSTVNALAFCPTGTHLASCSTDLSIKLWDFTNTYTCVRTLRGHDHTISSVKFAPISAIVGMANAAAAANHHHHRGTNGTSSSSFHYNTTTTTAASSSSSTGMDVATTGSSYLLSASRDQTVKLWHVETGFCDHTVTDHTDWVRCLAVRKSESSSFTWASSGNDQVIYVYEHRDKVMELRGHEHVVESLAFLTEAPTTNNTSSSSSLSSSSTKLHQHQNQQQGIVKDARDYLASGGRDRTVRLWKVSTGECLAVFKNHENWVRSVLIHPSGNYVISAGDDRSIRVFDIKVCVCRIYIFAAVVCV